jgi:hypothetical protein
MTSYLRKSLSMGVYSKSNATQNFGAVATDWPATNTPYVRFFVDWLQLAPQTPPNGVFSNPIDNPTPLTQGGTVGEYVRAIDNQIGLARGYKLKVVLTFINTPPWASGVSDQTPDFRLYAPRDLTGGGPWSQYFLFCFLRWSAFNSGNGGAYCDFFEICNEPNLFKPDPVSHTVPGAMMLIAQTWQGLSGLTSPILAGPALDDRTSSDPRIDSAAYTRSLLSYLRTGGFNFADPYWAWSHHNYRDIKGAASGTVTTTRAQRIRTELKNAGWRGWPHGDPTNPYILQTEGGARVNELGTGGQSDRIRNSYNLCHNDNPGQGEGLAMFTNYLDITDPGTDTGLRDKFPTLVKRPVYGTWASLPQP